MKLYRTASAVILEEKGSFYSLPSSSWDALINRDALPAYLRSQLGSSTPLRDFDPASQQLLAPVETQEVWAAGVTYYRSRDARMEEAQQSGGGSFYDRVYSAERPELFFKATPHRVVGHGQPVRIRRDATWNVPEPELTLVINARAEIVGYTIGNDMSSRDIEGENPLYLPQAKCYDGSCALGPAVLISEAPLPKSTPIGLSITRGGAAAFSGSTTLAELKRTPEELVEFLYRESSFPTGCLLMTGTGIVPPTTFTLEAGDVISITIEPIGTLTNTVQRRGAP